MNSSVKEHLKRLNLIMAGIHAIQAGFILILSVYFTLPVIGSFLKFNVSTQTLEPATRTIFNLSLPLMVAAFFLVSSLAHLIIGTIYNKKYNSDLKKGINKARWLEYSISASIMMVAISMLAGIYDFGSLSLIFTLVAVMNLCGLIMELYNQGREKVSWLPFSVGTIAGIVPWFIVAFTILLSASQGSAPAKTCQARADFANKLK